MVPDLNNESEFAVMTVVIAAGLSYVRELL